jgi:hypothetical protein
MPGSLTVVCAKCTRQAEIEADSRQIAAAALRKAGWKRGKVGREQKLGMICPKCPGGDVGVPER